eukprot:8790508-Pyramimonas_sp.AAC.1
MRADSPTCALEGLRLIVSWAAGTRKTLKCAVIASAYFQGQELIASCCSSHLPTDSREYLVGELLSRACPSRARVTRAAVSGGKPREVRSSRIQRELYFVGFIQCA